MRTLRKIFQEACILFEKKRLFHLGFFGFVLVLFCFGVGLLFCFFVCLVGLGWVGFWGFFGRTYSTGLSPNFCSTDTFRKFRICQKPDEHIW